MILNRRIKINLIEKVSLNKDLKEAREWALLSFEVRSFQEERSTRAKVLWWEYTLDNCGFESHILW